MPGRMRFGAAKKGFQTLKSNFAYFKFRAYVKFMRVYEAKFTSKRKNQIKG